MENKFIGIGKRIKRIKASTDRKGGGDGERVAKRKKNRTRENIMEQQKTAVDLNEEKRSEKKKEKEDGDSSSISASVTVCGSSDNTCSGSKRVETTSSSDSVDSKEEQIVKVILHGCPCSKSCLGFQIEGGSETSLKYICIRSLVPGSPAYNCGLFREGDQLIMIGKECCIGVTHREALEILRQAPASVEVIAQRKSQRNAPASMEVIGQRNINTQLQGNAIPVRDPLPMREKICKGKVGPGDCQLRGTKMAVELHSNPGEMFGFSIIGGRDDPYLRHIHVSHVVIDAIIYG